MIICKDFYPDELERTEQLPKVFFLYASIKMLNLLYFVEEFSHNNRPGSLPG